MLRNLPLAVALLAAAIGCGDSTAPGTAKSFTAVTTGDYHTCGITAAGAAYCWGDNSNGELGDGTTTDRLSPVLVAGGVSFAAVSASGNNDGSHTCGVKAMGTAYCWGDNVFGQLGDGTTSPRSSPVLVAGGMSFTGVSASLYHTCGVTAAGAAYCWGGNSYSQLGDGTMTDRPSPMLVAGGASFIAVSSGGLYTCGITATGAAYCWGDNSAGQLGDGTTVSRTTPVPVSP